MSKNTDFEKSLDELEKIVEELQNGDISLDESIKLFERGIKLSGELYTVEGVKNAILDYLKEGRR